MRRIIIRTLLLLCIAAPLAGQTSEWKKYQDNLGNFSVLFPGAPNDSVNPSPDGIQSHILQGMESPVVYMVVYAVIAQEQNADEPAFQEYKKGVFGQLPECKIITETAATPIVRSYIGHGYHLSCDYTEKKVNIAGNLYWGKHYGYAVMAFFPEGPDPAQVKKFTDSFAVTDTSK